MDECLCEAFVIDEAHQLPELAATMKTIAKGGANAFYRGPIAKKIVAEIEANGGVLTLDDFAQAVAWMASASGGNWKAPDAAMMHRIRHEAAERLEQDIKAKKAMKKMLERD